MADLPFPIEVRPWPELSAMERSSFGFRVDDPPLPPRDASRIGLVVGDDATRLAGWAFSSIPPGWPDGSEAYSAIDESIYVGHVRGDDELQRSVRRWLFDRRVPFGQTVYLVYPCDVVVRTTWKLVVRHWEAFARSVGYAMMAVGDDLRWACCFHHEGWFVFGDRRTPR